MSHETYTTRNPRRNPEDRGHDIIEEDAPVEIYDPNTARRRRNRIVGFVAAGAAAAVFAAGGFAWGQRNGNVEAKAPPVATAPANPNGPTAGASEAAPTPSKGETAQTSEYTVDTFPLVTPEGTFNGVEAFKEGKQLLVRDYQITGDEPAPTKKISALLTDFNALRNEQINSGWKQIESGEHEGYSMTRDNPALGSQETAVGETAVRYTYDKAYEESCVDDKTLAGVLTEKHKDIRTWRLTEPSHVGKYEVSGERGSKPTFIYAGNEVTFMNMITTYSDNSEETKDTVTKDTITFRQVLEKDGRLVWKVASFWQSEPIE